MGTTAYNAAIPYNAPIRYDGVTADVPDDPEPTGGGFPQGSRGIQGGPLQLRGVILGTTRTRHRITGVIKVNDDDEALLLLDAL